MTSVVFAISDGNLASDLTGILRELGDYEVRGQATTTDQARDLVARVQPEVLFVHEEIGPQPLHQTVRDLSAGYPDTSVLVISGARTSGKVIKALEAGARGVVAHPFAYEDVSSNASTARQWSEAIRATRKGIARVVSQRGSVVTVAGSKGGVGTTTIATHLALDYLAEKPDGRVCLVDADVEKGDVGAILEARQGVSIADVAKVADDMTAQTVNDALIHHETGIRLLLAPADVRAAEYVTPVALRAIVTVLREEFDLVVIDAGGHVSPTQAAAVEAADEVLIVTTADVMAVRAMRLRIQAWESLGVRHEAECKVLVNKVDKGSIFPSGAVGQLTSAAVLDQTIPYAPRVLELAANDRDPRSVTEVGWWRLIRRVRWALGQSQSQEAPSRRLKEIGKGRKRDKGKHSEKGAVALENAAMIPIALLMAVACWHLAVAGLSLIWVGHAGTVAAREYAMSGNEYNAQQVARDAVPGPFASGTKVTTSGPTMTVTMPIPASFAGQVGFPKEVSVTRGVVVEP